MQINGIANERFCWLVEDAFLLLKFQLKTECGFYYSRLLVFVICFSIICLSPGIYIYEQHSCIHGLRYVSTDCVMCPRIASCVHGLRHVSTAAPCIHGLYPWLLKVEPLRDSFDAAQQSLTQTLLIHFFEVNQRFFNCLFIFTTCLNKKL